MSNNRLYLRCTSPDCEAPGSPLQLLAKYYPTTGWYFRSSESKLNEYFELHRNCYTGESMWGDGNLVLKYEQTTKPKP